MIRPREIIIFFTLFLGGACFSSAASIDPGVKKVLERLERTWAAQQTEIATAHIRFRWAHGQQGIEPICHPLSPEQVFVVVNAVDSTSPEKAFAELVQKLYVDNSSIPDYEFFHAPPKSMIMANVVAKNREYLKGNLERYITLFDGKTTTRVDPLNNQIDVINGGEEPFSLKLLRFDPSFSSPSIRDKFSFTVFDNYLEATLDSEVDRITRQMDIETGLLFFRGSHMKGGKKNGRDRFQLFFFTDPQGIAFPRLSVDVNYENNVANVIDIYLIEEALFNSTIPDVVFKVSVPEGVDVWDNRYDERRPTHIESFSETSDIMSIVGDYVDYSKKDHPAKRWVVLVAVNIAILFLIAWRVFKKTR